MNVVLLLATVLGLGGLLLAAVISVTMGLRLRAAGFGAVAAGWTALYGAGLVGTSLASHNTVLPVGATKRFCGFYLDCHLGVAVVDAQTLPVAGSRRAAGTYRVVRLRLSSNAVRVTLRPEHLRVQLLASDGTRYERDLVAERALAGRDVGLEHEIAAGGGYEVRVVFDVPDGVRADWLYVAEGRGPDHIVEGVLIGDEDSFLHRKTLLALPE
jgi:hypothetical protein